MGNYFADNCVASNYSVGNYLVGNYSVDNYSEGNYSVGSYFVDNYFADCCSAAGWQDLFDTALLCVPLSDNDSKPYSQLRLLFLGSPD